MSRRYEDKGPYRAELQRFLDSVADTYLSLGIASVALGVGGVYLVAADNGESILSTLSQPMVESSVVLAGIALLAVAYNGIRSLTHIRRADHIASMEQENRPLAELARITGLLPYPPQVYRPELQPELSMHYVP